MGNESLSPSPIAVFLLELAERKASGTVDIAGRRVSFGDGEVLGVWPAERDESIGEFLAKSGRIGEHQLRQARAQAESEQVGIENVLVQQRALSEAELSSARRALWLDRLVRAMRDARAAGEQTPTLEPGNPPRTHQQTVRALTLTLDALARCAAESDAITVGSRLNDRVTWNETTHTEVAQRWAAFGALPERPAVSTILARNPAAAPHIAALLRAGIARLNASHQAATRKREITLPPPPPRLTPIAAQAMPSMPAPDAGALSTPPRPPRLRLDPGSDIGPVPTITRVSLRRFAAVSLTVPDPIKAIEDEIGTLEAQQAPGQLRAEAYCRLAEAYLSRLGSVEDAARAYREAAAASPSYLHALEQAARLCNTLGQTELALAYANAIVFAAQNGRERAHALRLAAALGRPTGQADAALEALCEAAAEDETDPEPHEIVARSLAERGNPEGAIAHGRLAASVWMADQPDRARSLIAWVDELGPAEPTRAREHARALLATSHPEAAVAILAAAARAISDPDDKRALMLDAAQQAEAVQRVDLAAELLTEAFDAEPHVDIFYEPLLADLASASMHAERAVIAADIARFAEGEARADWLCVAGEAMVQVARNGASAVQLFAQAIEADPTHPRALQAMREHAATGRDRERLADALTFAAAAHAGDDATLAASLWSELASLAEELGAVRRALSAMEQVARLRPDDSDAAQGIARLKDKERIQDELLAAAERELENAAPELRPKALRGMIAMLRDLPESRPQLLALHREYLELQPDDETNAGGYEWLLAVTGDWATLTSWLRARSEHTVRGPERARLLERLMLACAQQADDRGVAEAALTTLSITPDHPEAIARLNRAAVRLNDATLRREALTRSAQVALNGRMRGRALSLLAALLERTGELDAAVAAADQALLCDRSAADAALLLLRHAYRLPTERAAAALELCRVALGDSQPLLSTLARAAMAAGDSTEQQRALDAWCRLSPLDPEANLARLAARMKGENPQAVRQAAESCLALDVVGPSTATALRGAIARIAGLDAVDQAAHLALHALTVLGVRDANLLDQALDLARRCGQRVLITSALEHRLATLDGTARLQALREIAEHHRQQGDAIAEAHALVRLLPAMPRDVPTLDRLATLYAEQGDGERLLAALSLAGRDVADPEARSARLLDMAAAAAQVARDPERAVRYVHELIRDLAHDRDSLLRALGALVTVRDDERAALDDAMAIAAQIDPTLGGAICEWVAKTAEESLRDPTLALRFATQGLDAFPNQSGLLLMVERLTLGRDDVDSALSTYDKLVRGAMGHHGKRALHYRAGRWLERAGRPTQALDEYVRAFDMSPGAGVAFRAIERVARQTGTLGPLVQVYETLADVMRQANVQGELLQKAAELCLDGANDHTRAFRLLLRAWRLTGEPELQRRLTAVATSIWESDPALGRPLLSELIGTLHERAEKLWDANAKIDALLEVTRIEHDLLSQRDAALAALDAATNTAKQADDVSADAATRLSDMRDRLFPAPAPQAPETAGPAVSTNVADSERPAPAAGLMSMVLGVSARTELRAPASETHDATSAPVVVPPEPALATTALPSTADAVPTVAPDAAATPSATEPSATEHTIGAPTLAAREPEAQPVNNAAQPAEPVAPSPTPEPAEPEPAEPELAVPELVAAEPVAIEPVAVLPALAEPSPEEPQATAGMPDIAKASPTPPSLREVLPSLHAASDDTVLMPLHQAAESTTAPYEPIKLDPDAIIEPEFVPSASLAPRSSPIRKTGSYERPSMGPAASVAVGELGKSRSGGTLPQASRDERLGSETGAPQAAAHATPSTPSSIASNSSRADVLRAAIAGGDVAVCEELSDLLALSPDGVSEAHALLRTLVERQPWRTRALRKLLALSERVQAHTEERAISEILSVFDTSIAATTCPPFGPEQWPDDELNAVLRDGNPADMARVMTMTWEAAKAMPRFRKHISTYDVAERDRVTPGFAHPVADAMLWAAATLRLEAIPLYLRRHEEPRAFVVASNPPCLIATTGAASLGSTLLFQVASALLRCKPENALLATLPHDEGRTLIHAINAAFGPAGAPVSRDAAQLASELWHTMPMRSQREVRDILARTRDRLDYDTQIARLTQASARAGLVVAGSPRHAIFALTATDAECRRHDLTTEDGFIAAAHASTALQAVIRFALSDAYLLARTQS